jgi:hypothetical protein
MKGLMVDTLLLAFRTNGYLALRFNGFGRNSCHAYACAYEGIFYTLYSSGRMLQTRPNMLNKSVRGGLSSNNITGSRRVTSGD